MRHKVVAAVLCERFRFPDAILRERRTEGGPFCMTLHDTKTAEHRHLLSFPGVGLDTGKVLFYPHFYL